MSSDIFKGISGPDPDEKLAPNIIDKYIGETFEALAEGIELGQHLSRSIEDRRNS